MIYVLMQFGAWLRFAVQNYALLHQTHTVLKAHDLQSTSVGASWMFMISSAFGLAYAIYSQAPIVYAAANAFSVLCQGFILFRIYTPRLLGATSHE